jgi:valyl-tRNA synthetase
MSKSKGNVLDPIDLVDGIDLDALLKKRTTGLMQPKLRPKIEKATKKQFPDGIPEFGTDALRFTFAALASNGRDIRFDLGRIEGYRNFCNKIWNAARFVLMNVDESVPPADAKNYSLPDRWIRSQLSVTITSVRTHIENYRLDMAAADLYEFTWNKYCDWYLELTKPLLQSADTPAEVKAATQRTLIEVLETTLRALHPIIPFLTEEVWQRTAPVIGISGDTIMLQAYPEASDFKRDQEAEQELNWIMGFILGIRQIRGEMNIAPGKPLSVILQDPSAGDLEMLEQHRLYLGKLARLEEINVLEAGNAAPTSATALLGGMKILVPMAGLIDPDAERERLGKRREKTAAELQKIEGKLGNKNFVDKAPDAVVAKERGRQEELQQELTQLDAQISKLAEIA